MRKFDFKKTFFSTLIIISLFFCGTAINLLFNNIFNKPTTATAYEDPMTGMGLFISTTNDKSVHNQIIDTNYLNEYIYTFTNNTGNGLNCRLSVFINGNQVELLNTLDDTIMTNSDFFINNNESKDIPINLSLPDLDDGLYMATFSLVTDYDTYAIDNNENIWNDSVYNYDVAVSKNSSSLNISTSKSTFELEEYSSDISEFNQFIVNYSNSQTNNAIEINNHINSTAGSKLSIPLILGGGDTTESLLFATVDNKQILLNNSTTQTYSFEPNKCYKTMVELSVPDSPGNYELLFYSISNFNKFTSDNFADAKSETSHRITLVVE